MTISFYTRWMKLNYPNFFYSIAAIAAGAVFPLGLAPFNYFWAALLSSTLFLAVIINANTKQALWRGFLYGCSSFGVGVSWVFIAIHYFGNTAPWLAALLTIVFVFYLALFPSLLAYFLQKFFPSSSTAKFYWVYPSLWVLLEWLRGWFLTGFPWAYAGYSQLNTALAGFAPIGGVFLLSFLAVMTSSALIAPFYLPKKSRYTGLVLVILLWGIGYGSLYINWTQPNGKAIEISLLQGNIQREFKWNPEKVLANITHYIEMTKQHWHSDLIVWPEGTFSLPQNYGQEYIEKLDQEAAAHHSTVVIGLPYSENNQFFNSMMLLGSHHGLYAKRHLVPFGEYTPFSSLLKPLLSWLKIPMSDYTPGADHQDILNINGVHIAPFICYEIAYPGLVQQSLPAADVLLTTSEDAWYGNSIAVNQHLQMVQMRARESGRYSLFVANTGISAIINPEGKILQQLALNTQGSITEKIPAIIGSTPWIITGNWPWLTLMLVGILVIYSRQSRRHTKRTIKTNHRTIQ